MFTTEGISFSAKSANEFGTSFAITCEAKVIEKIFHGSDFLYKLELSDGERVYCYTPSHHNHSLNEVIGIKPVIDHLIIFN